MNSNKRHFTLYELNHVVREVLESTLPEEYWVEAELSECRESRGHCYLELIQKEEGEATPIAKASAKCWASKWSMLRPHFERTTGQPLRAGMKVLLRVYPQFHEAYGFSWIVSDIDPTYTLGDMARKRQEIIRQLKAEGVFDLQRELQLPLFPQRVAVISAATAAGYGDFCRLLSDNDYGFHFAVTLFPAVMQGEQVEESVISALNLIYDSLQDFDVVVIIRGGGATSDLSGFDTLALAENVAQFPLPIITGIGHERDESVIDMVSYQRVKTPTAAAAFLVSQLKLVLDVVEEAQHRISHLTQQKLTLLNTRLSALAAAVPRLFSVVKTRHETRLDQLFNRLAGLIQQRTTGQQERLEAYRQRLPLLMERRLTSECHRLELATEKLKMLDPQQLLRRGYSITLKDGKAVRDPASLHPGDTIETRVEKGTVTSIVK
jgi:exodeoxyribonuclease VII large subunit